MPEVEMRGIVKRFGGLTANDQVDFSVEAGEIRALVGENGAGKTTLMRILFGLLHPDAGEILVRGRAVAFHSPRDAIAQGIGMVHQHFMLFEDLTVAENVVYGMEPRRWGLLVDMQRARDQVAELSQRYGFRVNPQARVGSLSVGERQRVEILKILYRGANVLILDEPTAVLAPQERDELFEILRRLAEQNKAIILITHKLREVMAVSQTATVLRRGKVAGEVRTAESSPAELARLMVGREVQFRLDRSPAQVGPPMLSARGLRLNGFHGLPVLNNITFDVHGGEIVGIAGVAGNGQTELVDVLIGLAHVDAGSILLEGQDVTHEPILLRRRRGLAYIPEDRYRRGLAPEATVAENLALGFHRRPPLAQRGLLRLGEMRRWAAGLAQDFDIRLTDPGETAANLSGGNLQKVVLAREFSRAARFILADQPTRGVDIAATDFIHRKLIERRNAGDAILLVSADLDEILGLSDRILVLCTGTIQADIPAAEADEHEIGLLMAGSADDAPTDGRPLERAYGD